MHCEKMAVSKPHQEMNTYVETSRQRFKNNCDLHFKGITKSVASMYVEFHQRNENYKKNLMKMLELKTKYQR